MTLQTQRRSMVALLLVALSVAAGGCDAMRKNEFFARHISDEDQNVVARKRWDNFRGNVRLQMAEQHIRSGRFDEAEKVLSEAREMMPDEPEVLRLSAELHDQTGELTRAVTEIESYMALAPDNVEGRVLGGRIASRAGRIDDAIMWYRGAVELAPDEPDYRLKLAECLMARGDGTEALAVIEQYTQFEASVPLRQLAMEICDARGDADGAARHARAVAQIAIGDEAIQERAGIILANARAFEDAIAVLAPVIRRYIELPAMPAKDGSVSATVAPVEAIQAYAKSCIELNRDAEAMRVLKVAIREDPSDQVMWSLYCRAAIRADKLDTALEIVATFNRRNEPIPEMLVLEAYVYFLRGELNKARETADRALKIDPGFEAAFLLKAKASRDARDEYVPARRRAPRWEDVAGTLLGRRRDAEHELALQRQRYSSTVPQPSQIAIADEESGR
ncbi:MAG: tetratricopeptide repeat protein [Phycisphaerales bacterium]|nr:tetratricopeptide repeat protein [Phycisphaerales bacterium]